MRTALNVFGVLIIMGGIGSISKGEISFGVVSILCGALFAPYCTDLLMKNLKVKDGSGIRIGLRLVLFVIMGAFAPELEKPKEEPVADVEGTNSETPTQKTPQQKGGTVTFNADGEETGYIPPKGIGISYNEAMKGFDEIFVMKKGKMQEGGDGYIGMSGNFIYEISGEKNNISSMGFILTQETNNTSNQELNQAVLIQFLTNAFPEKSERQIAGGLVDEYFSGSAGKNVDEIINNKRFQLYLGANQEAGVLMMVVSAPK